MSFGTQFVHLIHLVSDRWAHEFMLFASLFYIRNTHKRTDIQTLVLPQTHKRRTNVIKLVPKWITQAHYSVELNIYNEPYNLNEYEKKTPKWNCAAEMIWVRFQHDCSVLLFLFSLDLCVFVTTYLKIRVIDNVSILNRIHAAESSDHRLHCVECALFQPETYHEDLSIWL